MAEPLDASKLHPVRTDDWTHIRHQLLYSSVDMIFRLMDKGNDLWLWTNVTVDHFLNCSFDLKTLNSARHLPHLLLTELIHCLQAPLYCQLRVRPHGPS